MSVNRLLEQFVPSHYDVSFFLQKSTKSFRGEVTLTGNLVEARNSIRLHAKDLTIETVVIDGSSVLWRTEQDDELVLLSEEDFIVGKHEIRLTYSAAITDPMHGLYPCYFEHDGQKKFLVATQFESHHAREAIPCIDEPAAKASFSVSVESDKDEVVLGNMPVVSQISVANNMLLTTFETTPVMSSYLVAFVVGELHAKEACTTSNVLVRTWATPAQKPESLDFALDVAVRSIEFFEEYFGVAYPLPKADHVALPDFSSGAMENWGLITYRESALLMDPASSSLDSKEFIATVIAHEVSHQWFGNLVTMAWWDDLWLNESFANLMEYVAIDYMFPEWQIWLGFASQETVMALRRDNLPGVQAIKVAVNHPDEISTLFDGAIVYAKGGNVLKMLMHYVGDDAFKSGLNSYFLRHTYKNTTGDDLWQALSESSSKDVKSFMEPWLLRAGFPVVTIDQVGSQVQLSQQQLVTGEQPDNALLWPIPLHSEPALQPDILDVESMTTDAATYVLLNNNGASFYVTHYAQAEHQNYLAQQIEDGLMSPVDRLRLLNESNLLARSGYDNLASTLRLASHYSQETRDAVWMVVAQAIGDVRRLLENDESLLDSFKPYVSQLVRTQYDRLGWDEQSQESNEDKKLRATIVGLAVWSELDDAKDHALHLFTSMQTPEDVPVEIRGLIYSTGAKWLGHTAYEKLFALYQATQFAEEKDTLVAGLTNTKDDQVAELLLGHMTDATVVRPQDVQRWFIYLLRNPYTRYKAWQWMTHNWQWIQTTFGGDKSYDDFPRYAGSTLSGDSWLVAYKTFFGPLQSDPSLARNITIGISEIEFRTAWQNRDLPLLTDFLAQ